VILSTLQDRAIFRKLAHISGITDYQIFMIILSEMHPWTGKSPNFGSHADPDPDSASGLDSRWRRSAFFRCSC